MSEPGQGGRVVERAPALTLVLPGMGRTLALAGPLRMPAMQMLVARAHVTPLPRGDLLASLEALVPELGNVAGLARAPLSRLGDTGERPSGWWLRLDPVHLATASDHLRLVPPAQLDIRAEESAAIAATLNERLTGAGRRIDAGKATRWYLHGDSGLGAGWTAIDEVIGRNVIKCIPDGPEAAALKRYVTEAQMLMNDHAVNRARARKGLAPINSVWPWGGGELGPQRRLALPDLACDEPVARGVWLAHGGTVVAPGPGPGGAAVTVLDDLIDAGLSASQRRASQALQQIERLWIDPLCRALRRGQVASLRVAAAGRCFELTRPLLARIWRRPGPLQALADGGAAQGTSAAPCDARAKIARFKILPASESA